MKEVEPLRELQKQWLLNGDKLNNMNKISAKIIADSKNEFGQRLTTFVLTFPRIVLAEFNTHRMFSRNSASSRAIPFHKMVKLVTTDPFIPVKWMKDHPGMQGTEYVVDEEEILLLKAKWLAGRDMVVSKAIDLHETHEVTKQLCNRLLEPFMWHTVIVTASEWENFFALRAHEAAEIHIQELAHRMLEQYNLHAPKVLKAGEWHIPFGDQFDEERIKERKGDIIGFNTSDDINVLKEYVKTGENMYKVKIATARCARVSYLNFEGKDDYEADIQLHDRLLSSGHMSPFEHCARAMSENEYIWHFKRQVGYYPNGDSTGMKSMEEGWSGNFKGFVQYRKMIEGENKSDNRVNK